jgi:GNAT superfamily N-acetyltransferase
MVIRHLRADELNALLDLYRHLHRADDPLPAPPVVTAAWNAILSNPSCRYLGAFLEETLVSSCALTVIPNLSRACRPYGLIENVVTHAGHRRNGHAKAVLGEALREAWTEGCYKVMLLTGRKDEAIARFYESAGFDRDAKQAFVARPGQPRAP